MNELKFNKSYHDIEIIHNLNNNTKKNWCNGNNNFRGNMLNSIIYSAIMFNSWFYVYVYIFYDFIKHKRMDDSK